MERAEVDFNRDVYCVMGLPIDAVTMPGAVERVRRAAFGNKSCVIATPNLNFVMMAREDEAFRNSVLRSDLVLADGMPLVWMARWVGLPVRERVSGAGLFENLLKHSGPPVTIYFFGGPEGAAEAACERVNQRNGGLRCVGHSSPGFGTIGDMSTDEHVAKINDSGAQFVIVSLGAKKGQAWIEHNRNRLIAPVICHLGAVVNFAAGTVRRAPRWMQVVGAEWLWRVKEEPGLWRRYWSDGVVFMGVLLRHSLHVAAQPWQRSAPPSNAALASVVTRHNPSQTTLELRGAWTHAELDVLTRVVGKELAEPAELTIDLTATTHLDNAVLGRLLLVHGALAGHRRLVISGASNRVAAIVRRSGAHFLLARGTIAGA